MSLRCQLLSDLHFEFDEDEGDLFIASLDPTDVDVLIAAGDIGAWKTAVRGVCRLAARFPHVVLVNGNHEFYGSDHDSFLEMQARSLPENVHLLENATWTHESGVKFGGCTLWFERHEDPSAERALADFRAIRDVRSWVYAAHQRSREFLTNIHRAQVIVTHHLPSYRCIHPRYAGQQINGFFATDLDATVKASGARVWAFGHTHTPYDGMLGATRLLCNPRGYPRERGHGPFNPKLVFDVEPPT